MCIVVLLSADAMCAALISERMQRTGYVLYRALVYDYYNAFSSSPHGRFTPVLILNGVPSGLITVTYIEWASFNVVPIHFDVQLVPPLKVCLIANFVLATGLNLFHRILKVHRSESTNFFYVLPL